MSKKVHVDKDGYVNESGTDGGVSVTISVDVDTVVCVNSNVVGDDGRYVVSAGSDLTVSADSSGGKITIVLHPGDLNAKCTGGREDRPKPKGP